MQIYHIHTHTRAHTHTTYTCPHKHTIHTECRMRGWPNFTALFWVKKKSYMNIEINISFETEPGQNGNPLHSPGHTVLRIQTSSAWIRKGICANGKHVGLSRLYNGLVSLYNRLKLGRGFVRNLYEADKYLINSSIYAQIHQGAVTDSFTLPLWSLLSSWIPFLQS